MRIVIGALVVALTMTAGAGPAGAVPGPGGNENGKFVYSEAIDPVTSNLAVRFSEGSQKRFAAVDYTLSATLVATWQCTGGQAISEQLFPTASLGGLVPDSSGRVSATATLEVDRGPGTACPGTSFQADYTNV